MTPHQSEHPTTAESVDARPGEADADARVETFSFELDDDLVKVVTVWHGERSCRVNVRYGRDYLLHEEDHVVAVDSPIEIRRHGYGISLHAKRRVFPFFARKIVRRF